MDKVLEEFQAYCDENLIKPRNIYYQFWRDSRVRLNADLQALRKECAQLKADNQALLEHPEDAL